MTDTVTTPTPFPERDALVAFVKALRDRHYGRMPTEVQHAYDNATALFAKAPNATAHDLAEVLYMIDTESLSLPEEKNPIDWLSVLPAEEREQHRQKRQTALPLVLIEALNRATGNNDWQGDASPSGLVPLAVAAIDRLGALAAVQPVAGWLYDWTHSSALGKPDEEFTSFTTNEGYAKTHRNPRAICVIATQQEPKR